MPSPQACRALPLPQQAYVEKYKFTSVVAQDLLDSFLTFFPELKEQSVDCRAGEAHRLPRVRNRLAPRPAREAAGVWAPPHKMTRLPGRNSLGFIHPSCSHPRWTVWASGWTL